jgi:hypothetical protein
MPNPIQASIDPALYASSESFSADVNLSSAEDAAKMCLSTAPATEPSSETKSAPPAPLAPGVNALVARFATPTLSRPPAEASVAKAVLHCALPIGLYGASVGAMLLAAPETFGAALVPLLGVMRAAQSLDDCLREDEAKQVASANRETRGEACKALGAVALGTADGSVLCVVPTPSAAP